MIITKIMIVVMFLQYFLIGLGFVYYAGRVSRKKENQQPALLFILVFWPIFVFLMFLFCIYYNA